MILATVPLSDGLPKGQLQELVGVRLYLKNESDSVPWQVDVHEQLAQFVGQSQPVKAVVIKNHQHSDVVGRDQRAPRDRRSLLSRTVRRDPRGAASRAAQRHLAHPGGGRAFRAPDRHVPRTLGRGGGAALGLWADDGGAVVQPRLEPAHAFLPASHGRVARGRASSPYPLSLGFDEVSNSRVPTTQPIGRCPVKDEKSKEDRDQRYASPKCRGQSSGRLARPRGLPPRPASFNLPDSSGDVTSA